MTESASPAAGQERFAMLAGAVAGRTIMIAPGDHDRAYCDGERIYTAVGETDPACDTVVVQAALLAAGSLEPRVVARLAGRRRLRHRYLVLEAARAAHELRMLMPRTVAERIACAYDGPVADSPRASLARAASEREDIPEAPGWMGTIRPGRVLMTAPGLGAAPTEQQRDSATKQVDLPELDEDDDSDHSDILDLFSVPTMQNKLTQYFQKLLGMGTTPSPDGDTGGDELPVGTLRAHRVGDEARAVDADLDVTLDLDGAPVGRLYPEYDVQASAYRPDWCSVTEYDPRPLEHEPRLEPADDRRLRRELARLGLTHERHRRQDEGDVLDVSALIEFVVDRRCGVDGDSRVYELKRRTAHDLGVLVLLDATGSTGESDEGSRIFDEQRELAAQLTSAFDELGDRVAAYGFQSWGRHRVQFLRVKGFDDRYDHAAQRRMAALEPAGFTRLGAAIRHSTYLLSNRAGTSSTLLVVVGDGLPYDDGYEQRHAHEDCRRALHEAVIAGVACACVSVRSSTDPEVIERVWGNVPHRSLERPSELATHVTPLFRGALKEAASSRRVVSV